MLRTAGWLALPRRALSAGFDGGISPPFQFLAAQLLGGWDLTETRLSLASPTRLLWTHTGGPHSGNPSTLCCNSQKPGPYAASVGLRGGKVVVREPASRPRPAARGGSRGGVH